MCFFSVDLNNINLDDVNFEEMMHLRNDDGDKHDNNCDDGDDDNKKSCKALMIDFDSLIFPFSLVI